MDSVQQTAAASPTNSATAKGPDVVEKQEGGGSALSSDFETFLKMLTVQMENQDPLNPIDSTDYAVQLATFSSVEQQVQTNDLIKSLTSVMTGGGLNALGQWVGMEVRGSAKARFDGANIDLNVPTNGDADRRLLVIRDSSENAIARIDLDLTSKEVTWDGKLNDGSLAPEGVYDFKVESYDDGALIESVDAQTYALVEEARVDKGATTLVLNGGIAQDAAKVTAIRRPTQ